MADLRVLARLLKRAQQIDRDVWRVTNAMLTPDSQLRYRLGGREYLGKVIEVWGCPGVVRVRVENLKTLKRRDISLESIVGISE